MLDYAITYVLPRETPVNQKKTNNIQYRYIIYNNMIIDYNTLYFEYLL